MNNSKIENNFNLKNQEKAQRHFETNIKIPKTHNKETIHLNKSDIINKNNSASTSDTNNELQKFFFKNFIHKKNKFKLPKTTIQQSLNFSTNNTNITKTKFKTDIKGINKPLLTNTLLKDKLELFYKNKLKVSLLSKRSIIPENKEISDILSETNKLEDRLKELNIIEKDPEKEEMKMLYRTNCLNEQIIYDKFFGEFFGFIATTFKNRKKENNNKLQIKINELEEKIDKKIHYFGILSGHKGINVSKYLKENLGKNILNNKINLISNPIKTIKESFLSIDRKIINNAFENEKNLIPYEKGGSCAHILININNKIYIGNCGNSRSIISSKLGKEINNLSIDHIPNDEIEKKRIEEHGGKVIKKNNIYFINPSNFPFSRSIGDYELKNNNKTKGIIVSEPDVIVIESNCDMDFILMGGFEIFLYMKNEDICKCVFYSFYKGIKLNLDYYKILNYVGTSIIETAIDYGAKDNLSIVLLIMKNLYKLFINKDIKTLENIIKNININTKDCYNLYTPNKFYGYNLFELNKANTIISSDDNDNIIVNEENNVKVEKKKKSFFSCLCFN